jgi:hypothetical protein
MFKHVFHRRIFISFLSQGSVQRDVRWVESRVKKSLYITDLFFKFNGMHSGEEHKTGFSVLTTIELNILVEFTKFCKRRIQYI